MLPVAGFYAATTGAPLVVGAVFTGYPFVTTGIVVAGVLGFSKASYLS